MKKDDKIFKPSKPNKILKGIFAFIATATMTLSAAACTNIKFPNNPVQPKPPVTDVDPNKPTNPSEKDPTQQKPSEKDPNENPTKPSESEQEKAEKLAFENAKTQYNAYVNKIFAGQNFTYQEDDVKTELADGKAKVTIDGEETYFAKEEDRLYCYSKDTDNEWQKEEEKEITIESIQEEIKNKLSIQNDSWTKYNDNTLIGTIGKDAISAQIDKNDTLTLKIGDKTITTSDLGKTKVLLPEIKEKFDVNEHIDELEKGLETYIGDFIARNSQLTQIFNVYLKQSEESGLVDTVGLVFEYLPFAGGKSLYYTEIKIDNVKEDITYEQICNGQLKFSAKHSKPKDILNVNILPSNQIKYEEGINILFDQLFEPNVREGAAWYGWRYDDAVGSYGHHIYMLKDNVIYTKYLAISSSGTKLNVEQSIEKNFKNQKEGDELQTWRMLESKNIEIPSDSINLWQYHQNNTEQE